MGKSGIAGYCGLVALIVAAAFLVVLSGADTAFGGDKEKRKDPAVDLGKVSISLIDAIARAEAKTGGKALEAELEAEKGRVVVEVETLKDGVVAEVKIDAASGEILGVEEEKESEKEVAEKAAALQASTVTLAGGILKAEAETGGRAIEAELEAEKDGVELEVKVVKDGTELEVQINAATGAVVKVEKEGSEKDDEKDEDKDENDEKK